jgi:hypothetical protein
MFNSNTSSSSSSIVSTTNNWDTIYTGIDPTYGNTGPFPIPPYTYTTTTTFPNTATTILPTSKRCRDCNHAHLNDQCVEYTNWGSVTFVSCSCKEYAPKDNLEYLEHLYDKKQRKEITPSL